MLEVAFRSHYGYPDHWADDIRIFDWVKIPYQKYQFYVIQYITVICNLHHVIECTWHCQIFIYN